MFFIEMDEGDEEQKKGAKVAQWKGCVYMCMILASMTRTGKGMLVCALSRVLWLAQERVCLYVYGPGFRDKDRKNKQKSK